MHDLIAKTQAYVKETLSHDTTGHDWWHIVRVHQLARHIALAEHANVVVVELAALLHDISDWKFNGGDETEGARVASAWLKQNHAPSDIISQVADIVATSSFKGAKVADQMASLEGRIVQDADRLDAIGAIGIARTFAYGGAKQRAMYDPHQKAELHQSFEAYKNNTSCTINHFYEKLLLLKDRMHTPTAQALAQERHQFMESYLKQFYQEWQGPQAYDLSS